MRLYGAIYLCHISRRHIRLLRPCRHCNGGFVLIKNIKHPLSSRSISKLFWGKTRGFSLGWVKINYDNDLIIMHHYYYNYSYSYLAIAGGAHIFLEVSRYDT